MEVDFSIAIGGSEMIINRPAPPFSLPDLEGSVHHLSGCRGKIVVINFWSAECPWSERSDQAILGHLPGWGTRVIYLAVAANLNEPAALLREAADRRGLPGLLHDSQGIVAGLYHAITTPHLFVVDQEGVLRYQGALDDVTFRQREPTRQYLVEAVQALLDGRLPEVQETPPYGCTIVRYS